MLNVGNGDSIVTQYIDPDGNSSFGVIDSNVVKGTTAVKAVDKLNELGATNLSFVMLTHPHLDHYLGLHQVFQNFDVETFYSFPIGLDRVNHAKKLAELAARSTDSDSESIRRSSLELIQILHDAKHKAAEWIELSGPGMLITPIGFHGVDLKAALPMRKYKGGFYELIKDFDLSIMSTDHANDISVAVDITYKNQKIMLGGDASKKNWLESKRQLARAKITNLGANVFKIPHHGSRADNTKSTMDYVFSTDAPPNKALISAIGNEHHPHSDVLAYIALNGIEPYCTNLAKECGNSGDVIQLSRRNELTTELNFILSTHAVRGKAQVIPCQGDVCVTIDDDGNLTVDTEINNFCPYRGAVALGL